MFKKKATPIFIAALFAMAFTGCSKKINYTTETYDELSEELEAHLTIPQFKDKDLEDFNDILKIEKDLFDVTVETYKETYWNTVSYFSEESIDEPMTPYFYDKKFKVTGDKNYVSVLYTVVDYSGGAHPNTYYETYCYDKKNKMFATLEEVTGKSEKELTKICREQIIKKIYKDSSEDEIEMWLSDLAFYIYNFTVEKGKVTIYFAPYEVAAYAEGTITVEIKR